MYCPASGFRVYVLKSLVCDLVDFFKEIGRESSLLADRYNSQPKKFLRQFKCVST
jgi:hypothetical protein